MRKKWNSKVLYKGWTVFPKDDLSINRPQAEERSQFKVRLIKSALPPRDLDNVFAEVNEEVEYASSIIPPRVNASSSKIDESIYTMLKVEGQFHNSTNDDPHEHLKNFLEVPRSVGSFNGLLECSLVQSLFP
ncbi:hypothetical protein HAX54_018973 [Datura stramonium]|uniref:Reverse transcriptase domain-containing protein n=1 Tax=Datura stramonium TaxID=4076 RepID=A0ABS8UR33_DATST|nr:hypothetical protein [Datura stramonium]